MKQRCAYFHFCFSWMGNSHRLVHTDCCLGRTAPLVMVDWCCRERRSGTLFQTRKNTHTVHYQKMTSNHAELCLRRKSPADLSPGNNNPFPHCILRKKTQFDSHYKMTSLQKMDGTGLYGLDTHSSHFFVHPKNLLGLLFLSVGKETTWRGFSLN